MQYKLLVVLLFFLLAACSTKPPKIIQTGLEVQAFQSHEFETTKRIAFDATMSVLQDAGFIIESADYETGFITGKGTTTSEFELWYGATNEHVKMSVFVEQRTSQLSRIRVNLVDSRQRKSRWQYNQDVIEEKGVDDPLTYQTLFNAIDQTIFVRENL